LKSLTLFTALIAANCANHKLTDWAKLPAAASRQRQCNVAGQVAWATSWTVYKAKKEARSKASTAFKLASLKLT
jgi:hypothetical protein